MIRRACIALISFAAVFASMSGAFYYGTTIAEADNGSAVIVPALVDAGAVVAPEPAAPADKLHDITSDPVGAYNDVRDMQQKGWAFAVLAVIVILASGLSKAASKWPNSKLLAWFAKNKTAIFVVSSVGAVAAASFNALVLGGTWMAVAFAGAGAALALLHPAPAAPPAAAR